MRPLRSIAWSAIAFLSGILLPAASSAAIMTFDNRGTFEAAVTGLTVVEDGFDNRIPGDDLIVFDSGVVSTNSSPSLSNLNNGVVFLDGTGPSLRYTATVSEASGLIPEFVAWSFPNPITGFGFDLANAEVGGLQIGFDGGTGPENFLLSDIFDVLSEGFVGFVADTAFQTIIFSSADPELDEGYSIDNLVFTGAPAAVPVPTTLPLTLFGIGTLLFFARKRRTVTSM